MTQITNKMEVNFPSLGGVLRSTADLPWRVAEAVFPSKKEEHVIRLRWPQRGLRGWPPAILSLENSLSVVSQDTAASPPGSSEEEDCAGWMVCGPLSSAPFPSPSLPLCPGPCLTAGNQPLDHRSPCSPLMLGSCFCSLRGCHMWTAHSDRSWHCRSTWAS